MNILIAFGSTEGQTRKIVKAMADQMRERGHEVRLFDTAGLLSDLNLAAFDRVVVAGSVHEKRHQESLEIFVVSARKKIEGKPALFVSVSLAAAFDDTMADARQFADDFLRDTGWTPTTTVLAAGAVKHGEYGYYREQILQYVVLEGRHSADLKEDHEFTDWDALRQQVDRFLES